VSYPPHDSPFEEREVWRLYRGTRAVGFGKRFGEGMMWSRTGAAYSGREIEHGVQVRALPLRTLSGEPIFHGDVVSPPGEDADRFLVLGLEEELLFAKAGTPRLIRREGSTLAQRRDFVRHGNVLESVRLSRTFDAALRAYAARGFPSGPLAWSLSILTVAGCVVAGMLQWLLQGGVGPFVAGAVGIAVGWGYFLAWKRYAPESFRRSTTRRVADGAVWRTASLFGAGYAMAGALGLPVVASSLSGILAGTLAAGVVGACFAMVAGVLAADSLTRHDDRKVGLPSELRSFLDLAGPYLRVRPEGGDDAPDETFGR